MLASAVALVVPFLAAASVGAANGPLSMCEDRDPHPPIEVRHEQGPLGLTWTNPVTGETEPRPGTGIVGGNGTAEDPYRIEGHCIQVGPRTIGVSLYNTSSHVVVQDNRIVGTGSHDAVASPPDSFQAGGVAAVVSVSIWGSGVGSYLSENLSVVDNRIEDVGLVGIYVEEVVGTEIRGNRLVGNGHGMTVLGDVEDVRVEANAVVDNGRGIALRSVEEVQVEDNRIHGNEGSGIDVHRSKAAVVADNRVTGNEGPGVLLLRTDGTQLVGNVVAGNDRGVEVPDDRPFGIAEDNRVAGNQITANDRQGILLDHSKRTTIEDNTVTWNGAAGIDVLGTEETGIRSNAIEANAVGLRVEAVDQALDARENWWGDSSGPSGGVVDACSGEDADGEGDAIVTVGASACFDPWRTSAPLLS